MGLAIRVRLQEDINISKQYLEVFKMASKVFHQKVQIIGEATVTDTSDRKAL
jgi:hypothetical protein